MAEYILKQAGLDALQAEGITRNTRSHVKIENSQLHNYIWTCKKGTIRKARIVPFPYFL